MMKRVSGLIVIMLLAGLLLGSLATARAGRVLNDALVTNPFGHVVWQDVITRYVDAEGAVNFYRLRTRPGRLNQYLRQLAAVSPENRPAYFPMRQDALAYWINAHNALAMRLILDRYPLEGDSLEALPDLTTNARYKLGGESMTLDDIAARIAASTPESLPALLALTDYSEQSPPLRHAAYLGNDLMRQLAEQASEVISAGELIRFDTGQACVAVVLSPFLRRYDGMVSRPPVTLARTAAHGAGQRDTALKPGTVIPEDVGVQWLRALKPLVPPSVYPLLGGHCPPVIRSLPLEKPLRTNSVP